MGKVLKPLALIAGLALQFIPGVGNVVGGLLLSVGLSATAATIALGALTIGLLGVGSTALKSGRAPTLTAFDPTQVNVDQATPRKLVFGYTAFPLDIRYAEPSGTNDEYVDYILVHAGHKAHGFDKLYIDNDLAFSGGAAVGKYSGFLWIEFIPEAGAGAYHTVNGGTTWNSTTRFTGCATMKLRIRRSQISNSQPSPFAGGLAGRLVAAGWGMPVYDPAKDSTVPGGSGSQRANVNSTWQYAVSGVDRGNNPALGLLSYMLGWKINGVPSVGMHVSPDLINLASFGAGAAICDEAVALLGGGFQRRYEIGGSFTDADDPLAVQKVFCDAMCAEIDDSSGLLALRIAVNDLATPVMTMGIEDIVSAYDWQKWPGGAESKYTKIIGRYSDASEASKFALIDYEEVDVPRTAIVPRILQRDLRLVQDGRRARRIAKMIAQRQLWLGEFSVDIGIRGWALQQNDVVLWTLAIRSWTAKPFRVRQISYNPDGTVRVVFREEDASLFAWSASEGPAVTAITPPIFDSRNAATHLMAGIQAGATRTVSRGDYNAGTTYFRGDEVILSGSSYRLIVDSSVGNSPPDATRWVLFAAAGAGTPGAPGDDGLDGITVLVSNEAHTVPTNADGSGGTYTTAGGTMTLLRGATTLAPSFSIAAQSPNTGWASINASTGVYTVTDPGAALATATLRAAFGGVNYDRTYTLAQSRKGLDGSPGAPGTPGTPGLDGDDGLDGADGKMIQFVWQRSPVGTPATPTGNGIPSGWSDNPPAGTDPLYMSRGKQELDGTLIGTWSAPIRHDGPPGADGDPGPAGPTGPAGPSAPPVASLSTGAAQLDPVRLTNGQTVTAAAELYLNTGGVSGICSLELQISEAGAGSWATMTGGFVDNSATSEPTSEAVELVISGATFTNSGADRLFDIRAVSVRRSRSINVPPSYVRVI
jgi:hypothetical protein